MLFLQERALGEASVQDDADACAAITDLILGEDCEAVLTTSPDLSSGAIDAAELEASCYSIAEDDAAGQAWCETEGYPNQSKARVLRDSQSV